MPRIPEYQPAGNLPAVQARPEAFSAPALEAAGLGAEMHRFAEILGIKRRRAAQADEFSTKSVAAAKELSDLDLELKQDPDFGTMVERFEERSGEIRERHAETIGDGEVRRQFLANFDNSSLAKRTGIQVHQARQRVDFYRANLRRTLGHYHDLMATTSGPTAGVEFAAHKDRALANIDQAAQAGMIDREEAVVLKEQFVAGAAESRVRRDIMANPRRAFLDVVSGNYEGLTPEGVTSLTKEARGEWNYRLALEEKADAETERLIKRAQDQATLDFLVKHGEGELTIADLNTAAKSRGINATQYRTLYNMTTNPTPKKSVEAVMLSHLQEIDQGGGDREKILTDASMGLVTPADAMTLLSREQAWQDREDKNQNTHRKWAAKYLERRIVTTGPLAHHQKPEEGARLMGATRELDARIEKEGLEDWEIRDAATEIGEAWAVKPLGTVSIRKVRGTRPKSIEEVEALRQQIIQDLYDEKISSDDAARDAQALDDYEAVFRRHAETQKRQAPTRRR